ncbi:MAG: HigA family addiction module antitoxin [Treponema sp.]
MWAITLYRLSKDLGVSSSSILDLVHGKKITVEMSLRLSKYFRTSSKFWLNMQNELDLREAAHKSVRSKISSESTFLFMNITIFQEKFALKNHKIFLNIEPSLFRRGRQNHFGLSAA